MYKLSPRRLAPPIVTATGRASAFSGAAPELRLKDPRVKFLHHLQYQRETVEEGVHSNAQHAIGSSLVLDAENIRGLSFRSVRLRLRGSDDEEVAVDKRGEFLVDTQRLQSNGCEPSIRKRNVERSGHARSQPYASTLDCSLVVDKANSGKADGICAYKLLRKSVSVAMSAVSRADGELSCPAKLGLVPSPGARTGGVNIPSVEVSADEIRR